MRPHVFAGKNDADGNCDNGQYSDPYGSWEKVVVEGTVKVLIREMTAVYNPDTGKLVFPNGLSCVYKDGHCEDTTLGELYWEHKLDVSECTVSPVNVLYQGYANISTSLVQGSSDTIATVEDQEVLFSLRLGKSASMCGLDIVTTEHPRLLIARPTSGGFYFRKLHRKTETMDLFTYINSKFVYVERNVRMNMERLYKAVAEHACLIEKMTLQTQLSIALKDPNEFAFLYMGGPGYAGVVLGEAIYILQCQAVEATIRRTQECYKELPVIVHNTSYFMTPKHHLLQKLGTEIACNGLMPPLYSIDHTWYTVSRTMIPAVPPNVLTPGKRPAWDYRSPGDLARSGIYSQEDLQELRSYIMNGPETTAVLQAAANNMRGEHYSYQGADPSRMFNEEGMKKIAEGVLSRAWGVFSVFGTFMAGLMGLVFVFKVIKWFIDTILHVISLKRLYGVSFVLLAAIWDSLTLCMIERKLGSPGDPENQQLSDLGEAHANRQSLLKKDESDPPTRPPSYPVLPPLEPSAPYNPAISKQMSN